MATPLEIYAAYQQCLQTQDYAHLVEVVDLQGYTENCLGLTGWTTGFDSALKNYQQGIASVLTDMKMTEQDVLEGADTLVLRSRIEATHSGPFLGAPPTGRRMAYDAVDMFRVREGRIVWRFLLCDWHGALQQIQQK